MFEIQQTTSVLHQGILFYPVLFFKRSDNQSGFTVKSNIIVHPIDKEKNGYEQRPRHQRIHALCDRWGGQDEKIVGRLAGVFPLGEKQPNPKSGHRPERNPLFGGEQPDRLHQRFWG